MKLLISLVFFLQSILIFSQNSETKDKYNLDNNCYEGTQQDINYCLSKLELKLSKDIQIKYDCIIAYFDLKIKYYTERDTSIATDYIKMKKSITESQATWGKLKMENASFYTGDDGSETPMFIGQSLIKDDLDRLKWMDNLIEEEGQGNETEILKCK